MEEVEEVEEEEVEVEEVAAVATSLLTKTTSSSESSSLLASSSEDDISIKIAPFCVLPSCSVFFFFLDGGATGKGTTAAAVFFFFLDGGATGKGTTAAATAVAATAAGAVGVTFSFVTCAAFLFLLFLAACFGLLLFAGVVLAAFDFLWGERTDLDDHGSTCICSLLDGLVNLNLTLKSFNVYHSSVPST